MFTWPFDGSKHATELLAKFVDDEWLVVKSVNMMLYSKHDKLSPSIERLSKYGGQWRVTLRIGNVHKVPENAVTEHVVGNVVYNVVEIPSVYQIDDGGVTYHVVACFGMSKDGFKALFTVDHGFMRDEPDFEWTSTDVIWYPTSDYDLSAKAKSMPVYTPHGYVEQPRAYTPKDVSALKKSLAEVEQRIEDHKVAGFGVDFELEEELSVLQGALQHIPSLPKAEDHIEPTPPKRVLKDGQWIEVERVKTRAELNEDKLMQATMEWKAKIEEQRRLIGEIGDDGYVKFPMPSGPPGSIIDKKQKLEVYSFLPAKKDVLHATTNENKYTNSVRYFEDD